MIIDALMLVGDWHPVVRRATLYESVAATHLARVEQVRRLSKQLRKSGQKVGWLNHAVTLMYVGPGQLNFLIRYYNACLEEWSNRGYRNDKLQPMPVGRVTVPWWFGWEELHMRHRMSLVNKNRDHYEPLFGRIKYSNFRSTDSPYAYPSRMSEGEIVAVLKEKYA